MNPTINIAFQEWKIFIQTNLILQFSKYPYGTVLVYDTHVSFRNIKPIKNQKKHHENSLNDIYKSSQTNYKALISKFLFFHFIFLTNPCIKLVSLFIQYKFIRQFKVGMSDPTKRSLREKRAPKNFDSDNEDKDPWGYSRPGYSKEIKNPAQQMNSDAKLLVKFISAINKSYREYNQEPQKHQAQDIRVGRKTKSVFQMEKTSNNDHTKEIKPHAPRKNKDAEGFQPQGNSNYTQNQPKIDSLLNKFKELNTEFANKMLTIQSNLSNKGSLDAGRIKQQKLQTAIQESQMRNKLKKNSLQTNIKPEIKNVSSNNNKQKDKQAESTASTSQKSNKIFKRSTYHIAIAYQIHVNNVRQRGGSENEFDPTYPAKKLRERIN